MVKIGCRAGFLLLALNALSATTADGADKSRYSLVNPTPKSLLRDLTTDRPDLTESPFTVDAGRIQVKTSAFGYARSRADSDGVESDVFEYATTNIRVGITHNTEINVVLEPYGVVRSEFSEVVASRRDEGIGSLFIRGKVNLFGNDAFQDPGDMAAALLPFIVLPTDSNNGISAEDVEGGLIVPFAVVLPRDFGLGVNVAVTAIKDDDGSGYHVETLASLALSYEWNDRFGTYYEIATVLGTDDPRGDILVLGTGFTYAVNDNFQLDGGINFGVTSASDRVNPFVGLTRRF